MTALQESPNAVLAEQFRRVGACEEAVEFLEQHDDRTPEQWWNNLTRGDWMVWILARITTNRPFMLAWMASWTKGCRRAARYLSIAKANMGDPIRFADCIERAAMHGCYYLAGLDHATMTGRMVYPCPQALGQLYVLSEMVRSICPNPGDLSDVQ